MNRLCNSKRDCEDQNSPLLDYSTETPDHDIFLATQTQNFMPPALGSNFLTSNCFSIAEGQTQEEANGLALSSVIDCIAAHSLVPPTQIIPDPPGTPPDNRDPNVFTNADQLCTSLCPDGLPFTFIVPSGRFFGFTQDEADDAAHSYACANVIAARICIGSLTIPECCLNQAFSEDIVSSGAGTMHVFSGALPTGLSLSQVDSRTARISGTPTVIGNFVFTLRLTDANGDYMDKVFQMRTIGILTSSLPSVQSLNAYSQQIVGSGNTLGTVVWSISSGSLPPGLSFNASNQTISGTPTTAGDFPFTVQMNDGVVPCQKQFSIQVLPCLSFNPSQLSPDHWYRAETIGLPDLTTINNWADFGSKKNDFSGTTSATWPVYRTNALNGYPIVSFEAGHNDVWNAQMPAHTPGVNNSATDFFNQYSYIHLFFVAQNNKDALQQSMVHAQIFTPGSGGIRVRFRGTAVGANWGLEVSRTGTVGQTAVIDSGVHSNVNQWYIIHVAVDFANGRAFMDIDATAVINNAVVPDPGISFQNSNTWFPQDTNDNKKFAEWVVFGGDIGQTSVDKVVGYLAWKYALQGNLPNNHPYKNSTPCAL